VHFADGFGAGIQRACLHFAPRLAQQSYISSRYSLHGLWDLLHELQAHGAYSAFEPGQLTAVPLAYGVFCAAFDFCMAAYFYARRAEWIAAWKAVFQ
jgi:hypothetical protein